MFVSRRASALAEPKTHANFTAFSISCPEPAGHIARRIKVVFGAAALLLLGVAAPAQAGTDVVIDRDFGGNVFEYAARAHAYAAQNVRIVIRGECMSACTLYLGNPRTCAEPDAVLRLHTATWTTSIPAIGMVEGQTAPEPTRKLVNSYPRRLKSWIARHGGLTQNWLVLEKQELLSVIPPCKHPPEITAAAGERSQGRVQVSALALKDQ